MTKKRVAKEIVAWFLSLYLCFLFAKAGIAKFDDGSGWSSMFRAFGFPLWFRLFIGAWETAAAALILWPRTAAWAAAMMDAVMIGAIITFATRGHVHGAPITGLIVATIVLVLRYGARAFRPLAPARLQAR
jgi:putative oxidoreductase